MIIINNVIFIITTTTTTDNNRNANNERDDNNNNDNNDSSCAPHRRRAPPLGSQDDRGARPAGLFITYSLRVGCFRPSRTRGLARVEPPKNGIVLYIYIYI